MEQHPQFAVSKWIGHSIEVSGKHYANAVPDELLAKAATGAKGAAQTSAQNVQKSDSSAAQKAAQQPPEMSRDSQKMQKPSEEGISHMSATTRELSQVL
jgi:hypothetical protein